MPALALALAGVLLALLLATATPGAALTATVAIRATPTPSPPLAAVPPVYYQDNFQGGRAVYAVYPDGSSPTLIATIPPGNAFQPVLLPDGRLLYPSGNGFAVVDRFGRRYSLRTPDLQPGEIVWSVAPSPDGRTLAWQLFAPQQFDSYTTAEGSARIVLTGRFGDAGTTVFSAQASGPLGQVPALLGWRPSSPYGLGGPTLLLQDLYSGRDTSLGLMPNARRGLLEYDPTIDDVVNDYLPPGGTDIPPQRALTVSADGVWAVYGEASAFTPSGEGPLARVIAALNLDTNAVVRLDAARSYPTTGVSVTRQKRKVGKRTVTRKLTTRLRLYQYFSHRAYVAPGDGRVLYTLLTVSYPRGALVPRVRETVLVATTDGRTRRVVAPDAQAEGWLTGHRAVIKRADGLYVVDVVFGGKSKLAVGPAAEFIGAR